MNKQFYIHSHSSVPWQQKIIYDFLKLIPINNGVRCLDAGSGIGNNLPILLKFFQNITACDVSEQALNYARNKINNLSIKFTKADLNHIPFPDDYFDVIICTEVLEHTNNFDKIMNELMRVLKKDNGYLIVSTPNYFNLAGIFKLLIDKISGKKNWNVWGTSQESIEKMVTWHKLRKTVLKNDLEILRERGGDFLNSWLLFLPFIFRNFKCTDRHPFLKLGKIPFIKKIGMNYFILAKTS